MHASRFLLLSLLALGACQGQASLSDTGFAPDSTTGASPTESDRYAIYSTENALKVGLTDDVLYYRLSEKLLAQVDRQIEGDAGQEGLASTIERAVKSGVTRALRHRVEYRLDRIEDVRFAEGQLLLVFTDGTTETPTANVNVTEGAGATRRRQDPTFEAAAAQRFIAAFHATKAGQTP